MDNSDLLKRLSELLNATELEKLALALEAIKVGAGWGDLVIHFKSGQMDKIEITSSILVRDKSR